MHLWATKQYLIPNNLHVDHINNDCLADRLDNYQLLTNTENVTKARLLMGALYAVLICPVCLKHFEKRAATTQYAASNNKARKKVCYCSNRCHMAAEFSMQHRYEYYRELRDWISDNQIYKLVHVWVDGRTEFKGIVSEAMLDFNLEKALGRKVEYNDFTQASTAEKKVMIRDWRNEGLDFEQIAAKVGFTRTYIWQLAEEPIHIKRLNEEELTETLTWIKKWRAMGYSQARIGALLGIPRPSVSNYVRRHAAEWDIFNEKSAAKGDSFATLICPICHSEFERSLELTQLIGSRKGRIMCCSHDCRWDLRVRLNRVDDRVTIRKWISENQIIRVDKVIANGVRFFDREVPHNPAIRTLNLPEFDMSLLDVVST